MSKYKILSVESADELEEYIPKDNSVNVIQFSADFCGPCKVVKSQIEKSELTTDYNVKFYYLDIDGNRDLVDSCKVGSIPTFFLLKKGISIEKVISDKNGKYRFSGSDKKTVEEKLKKLL